MTVPEMQWLVGTALGVIVTMAGIAAGAFRAMAARLDQAMKHLETTIRDGDDKLHERINRVRDEYVRRVDLDDRLKAIGDLLAEMRADLKDITQRGAAPPTRRKSP